MCDGPVKILPGGSGHHQLKREGTSRMSKERTLLRSGPKNTEKLVLYVVILVDEWNIPNPAAVVGDKLTVTGRSLIARIGCQHALETHADTFNRLHRGPARRAQEIETDDPVTVDVRMHGDRARRVGGGGTFDELDLGRLCENELGNS